MLEVMTDNSAQDSDQKTSEPTSPASRPDQQPPTTFLILGAGGDLTKRLLLPGLASLLAIEPQRDVTVIGADQADKSDDDFRQLVREAFGTVKGSTEATEKVAGKARYVKADLLDCDSLKGLLGSCEGSLVIYFALPPAITMKVCAELEKLHLPAGTRLGLEKPFGNDEASAREFNAQLQRVVPESHIFRVDHFLGTSSVLNLIGLRFANRILQPIWSSDHIERVEISYDEDLALEGRAGYYDKAGALRDMLQSHLLQILAIFAMEPIATLEPTELQDLKSQVLRATKVWNNDPVGSAKRARYTAGIIGDRHVPSYVDEQGVDPSRNTETLAQMVVEVDNNRWNGVPILLRSGKGLGAPHKQIVCYFRDVPHVPNGFRNVGKIADKLIIRLKPGQVCLELSMNAEGDPLDLEQKRLKAELADAQMTAYGEVLRYVLDGNQLISVRADQAELCWHIMAPVIQAFADNKVPIEDYPAGSNGPEGWLEEDSVLREAPDADAPANASAPAQPSGAAAK